MPSGGRALLGLFAAWVLLPAAFIEFYARHYEYAGTPLFPDGALVIVALALLLLPRRLFAHPRLPPGVARAIVPGFACAVVLFLAMRHPLQLAHVLIVAALPALGLLALSPLLCRPGPPAAARVAAAATLALATFALLAYYAILVIGLEMWNEVVTRELIHAYAPYLPELVAALPVSPWMPWAIGLALLAALFVVYWLAARALARGTCEALRHVRGHMAPAGKAGWRRWAGVPLVLVAYVMFTHAMVVTSYQREPLVSTFIAAPRVRGTPWMPFRSDPALDALERSAASRYAVPAQMARRTIVLVTVDALRADQMNVYGHARDNTPFLSRLWREGRLARFDNVFSACTSSLCGLLSVLNSRYWHELGGGRQRFGLADVLQRLGYRNYFMLSGDHTRHYGLRSYYGNSVDQYSDGSYGEGYMNDDAEVLGWVRKLDLSAGTPSFLWVHLMSTHQLGTRDPQFDRWRGMPLVANEPCCTSRQTYANNYHQGIRQTDALLEQLFAILAGKGILQDALVAITSDHGELLGELGFRVGHGGPPVDPVVRVPLLIYDAQGHAYPRSELASVLDVAPTLLDRIGAPIPPHWSGVPLTRPAGQRFVFMQSPEEFAVVGDFAGALFKYYHRPGGDPGRLVRLGGTGVEEEVPPSIERDRILRELRGALPPRVLAARRDGV